MYFRELLTEYACAAANYLLIEEDESVSDEKAFELERIMLGWEHALVKRFLDNTEEYEGEKERLREYQDHLWVILDPDQGV